MVWVQTHTLVERNELAGYIIRRQTLPLALDAIPFASSMLSAFAEVDQLANVPGILTDHTLRRWLSEVPPRAVKENDERITRLHSQLWGDREWANRNGVTGEERGERLREKTAIAMSTQAHQAAADLRVIAKASLFGIKVDTSITFGEVTLRNMPLVAMGLAASGRITEQIMTQIKRPSEAELAKHRSDVTDLAHLVGAAYCDVFSCDQAIQKHILRLRDQLGKPQALALKGGEDRFRALVEKQIQSWKPS